VTLRNFNTLLEALTALPILAFVVNYFFRSRWHKNIAGWNLLIFMAVVGEILVFALYYRITHHRPPEWLGTVCWSQIMAASWWRLGILVVAQRHQWREVRRALEREHELEKH
jgi:uncharacterized BrkB/YihY/UPF0761 family membrane protein